MIERPKMGLVYLYMSGYGPLRDWAENLIDKKRLDEEGYFNSGRSERFGKITLAENKIRYLFFEHINVSSIF